jgi:predicted acetyltransferase
VIRWSTFGDRDDIFEIWKVCFGDDDTYINFFINHRFEKNQCLVWEEQGAPVAMLHLLSAEYLSDEKSILVQYVYAAATKPVYRGRGIMAQLLDYAVKLGAAKGCLFTFLLPSNDRLYDYYGKLGFKPSFFIKKANLTRNNLETATSGKSDSTDKYDFKNTISGESLFKIRQAFFAPAVLWKMPELSYVLAEWNFTGGEILQCGKGYVLCREHGGAVEVREVCGSFEDAVKALLLRFSGDNFTLFLPPYANLPFQTQTLRYGMLRPSDPSSNIVEAVSSSKPYINLLLE